MVGSPEIRELPRFLLFTSSFIVSLVENISPQEMVKAGWRKLVSAPLEGAHTEQPGEVVCADSMTAHDESIR